MRTYVCLCYFRQVSINLEYIKKRTTFFAHSPHSGTSKLLSALATLRSRSGTTGGSVALLSPRRGRSAGEPRLPQGSPAPGEQNDGLRSRRGGKAIIPSPLTVKKLRQPFHTFPFIVMW